MSDEILTPEEIHSNRWRYSSPAHRNQDVLNLCNSHEHLRFERDRAVQEARAAVAIINEKVRERDAAREQARKLAEALATEQEKR